MTPAPPSAHALPGRLALRGLQVPRAARLAARLLAALLVVVAVALTVTPWQQTIPGTGRVIALAPEDRVQDVEAPVDGRVIRWHVGEGQVVRRGDPLVDLSDNDAEILRRLEDERRQVDRSTAEAEIRRRAFDVRLAGLEEAWRTAVTAADERIRMSQDRVAAAEQGVTAAEAALLAARLNASRQRALLEKGLTSTRNAEVADMELAQRDADVKRARATVDAARREVESLLADRDRTDADGRARLDEARAALAGAAGEVARAEAESARMNVRLARQQAQQVTAPVDGTVLRILARQSGEQLKAGAVLLTIVPESRRNVVELWVQGNDMPMVAAGRQVRLQFEGWPALQFTGWPAVAVGTFGGRVVLVDAADNGRGQFRVLVEPDSNDDPWPSRHFLRQGVRANGWVMLNVVPIGFEIWRQFNGFPPVLAPMEPATAAVDGGPEPAAKP